MPASERRHFRGHGMNGKSIYYQLAVFIIFM